MLGQYGANAEAEPPILTADENTELTLKDVFGDENAQTYVVAK